MATVVTFNGVNYSIPAANEEDWQSLSNYLIALASGTQTTNGQKVAVRVSTTATTTVATTDCILLINVAGAATVNLPVGVEKQIFYIADLSGAAATNNITINRAGGNTILGGTSYVMNLNAQIVGLVFTGGNWYRFSESFPTSLVGPTSAVDNGVALFNGTSGRVIKDLGVGTANQVLTTNGTTPSFALIANANVDASAAIAYSKLALTGSIVNADISASAAIAYSKLALTGSIVNADISASAAIAYSKLALSNSIVNNDINTSAAIAYSKLNLSNSIVNNDINSSAAIAYSKLNLSGSIVNADINAGAAIAYSKLALTGSIVDADVATGAAIARSKIAAGTASHVVVNDGSGNLSSVATLPVSQGGTGLNALGSALQLLRVNAGATGLEFATISGVGDVSGPSSSVTNGIAQFASTTGKALKDLGVGLANQVLLTDGTTPSFGAITNAYIDSGAAIALSKLAALTASRALVSNGSGVISVSSVTDTELGYVSGVTSAIQTQLNTKANDSAVVHISGTETITGAKTFSSIIASSLTSNQFIAGNVTLSFTNSGTPTTITIPNVAPVATIPLLENAQTFTAQQSFSNNIVVQNRVIVFGTSQTITILGSTPASSRFVTIPEAGADSDFVLTAGSQTIGGSKTFSSAVTINTASNQVILSSGVNQLTLNSGTSAAARTYTVPDTGTTDTFAMLGGAQAFTALKTFNSGLAIAGGAAANNTIWVASNTLNIRGGTSGTDIYNTSGSVVVDITDAGAVTLGPANSSLVHITNGSGLSVRNNGASGGYVDGRQSGTAQWFVGKHSYNVFSGSSFGIGAVVAGLGVEFAAGNAIAGSISAAGAWTLGPTPNFSSNFNGHNISGRTGTSAVSPSAGYVGEFITAFNGVTAYTSASTINAHTLTITSGVWRLDFQAAFYATAVTAVDVWLADASASTSGRVEGSNWARMYPGAAANMIVVTTGISGLILTVTSASISRWIVVFGSGTGSMNYTSRYSLTRIA